MIKRSPITCRSEIYVQNDRVKNYALRRIDPALWRRVKARAGLEGRSVRTVILDLLRVYAKHGSRVIESFDRKNGGSH